MNTIRELKGLTPETIRERVTASRRGQVKLANNTVAFIGANDDVCVDLHATTIIRFHVDGSFTVNSGGWRTVTTQQRLNALLPAGFRVEQKRFQWFINTPEGRFDFEDGDTWKAQ